MQANDQQVVVLGNTGFIGKNLQKYLDYHGVKTFGASSTNCNLLDPSSINQFFSHLPEKIHLVFCSAITPHYENNIHSFHKNVTIIENFLNTVSLTKFNSIIFLSSVDIYGHNPILPITENTLPDPKDYYGLSKFNSEILLKWYCQPSNIPLIILRLPGIYGPEDQGKSIIGFFFRRLIEKKVITINNNGNTLRDYVEINDLNTIVKRLITNPNPNPDPKTMTTTINIASGQSIRIKEIIDTISRIAEKEVQIEISSKVKKADYNLVFNNKALRSLISEFKFTTLNKGFERYVNEYQ